MTVSWRGLARYRDKLKSLYLHSHGPLNLVEWWVTYRCFLTVSGHFSDGHFPGGHISDWHFPEGHFPNKHFHDGHFAYHTHPRRTLPGSDTSPTDTSLTDIFPTDTSKTGISLTDTSPTDIFTTRNIPYGHFLVGYFPERHFPDQTHPRRIFPGPYTSLLDTFPARYIIFYSLFDCNIFPNCNFYLHS